MARGQIWRCPLQIQILLWKLVQMIYRSSHLKEVTWPSSQYPSLIYPYWELQWEFKISLLSPQKMGLGASWIIQIGGGHPTCSWCPHHYLGYSRSHKQNQAFSFADSQSSWKINPGTGWTVQIGGGQIFKPLIFCKYFAFYSLIRKYTKMGPPDLECPQKSAPGDIWNSHFG